ncbi:MAG: hypothetical protein QNJ60_00410 [Xenococcaceae cyanobacterium MO_188.B19]|nr:hypothetical protein [Xenococcaceae cyanobacterium MO_188.B19]
MNPTNKPTTINPVNWQIKLFNAPTSIPPKVIVSNTVTKKFVTLENRPVTVQVVTLFTTVSLANTELVTIKTIAVAVPNVIIDLDFFCDIVFF